MATSKLTINAIINQAELGGYTYNAPAKGANATLATLSDIATLGPITITGTVNGSNRTFTIPANIVSTSLQIFDGTQYQTQGTDYTVSGTTLTFAVGHAPVVALTGFGASNPITTSAFMYIVFSSSYANALTLATGAQPFMVFVAISEQFNNQPTLYIYDGITTGRLSQVASVLI